MRKNNKGNNMKKYSDFLKSKMVIAKKTGINIDPGEISPAKAYADTPVTKSKEEYTRSVADRRARILAQQWRSAAHQG